MCLLAFRHDVPPYPSPLASPSYAALLKIQKSITSSWKFFSIPITTLGICLLKNFSHILQTMDFTACILHRASGGKETFCVILCISRIYQIAWFLHSANMWLGIDTQGFPGSSVVKIPPAMDTGFDPWVQKIPWRRKWLPTPVFFPGKSHGQRSRAGMGLQKS